MQPIVALAVALILGLVTGPMGFYFGAVAGLALGVALENRKQVSKLKERLQIIEARLAGATAGQEPASAPADARAAASTQALATTPAQTGETALASPPAGQPTGGWDVRLPPAANSRLDRLRRFLLGGNPVVRIGAVILLLGFAFLLRYAYEQAWLPIGLRLTLATVAGMALVLVGFRARLRPDSYGVVLQGLGVGVLYLTIFAAARLYDLIPMPFAFTLIVTLVGASSVLAVLQRAEALAIFAMSGGFLAPVLLATGSGSSVALFSYYLVLNLGIAGMAWFSAWRWLGRIGFLFTFLIGARWGLAYYAPELFLRTEPFLLAFLLLYIAIAVLIARRLDQQGSPPVLDGTLVFGVPLTAIALQWGLVRDSEFGMALTALGLAGVYVALGGWLKPKGPAAALLGGAFLALAVAFATLAIPFAFDNAQLIGATWALEGAALVWVGLSQQRLSPRLAGLTLQLAGALAYLSGWRSADTELAVLNGLLLGGAIIGVAGLLIAWLLSSRQATLYHLERPLRYPVLAWGTFWWIQSGLNEITIRISGELYGSRATNLRSHAAILFVAISLAALARLAQRLDWREGRLPGYLILLTLGMTAFGLIFVHTGWKTVYPLADYGWIAWPVAVLALYAHLVTLDAPLAPGPGRPSRGVGLWHAGSWWLVSLILTWLVVAAIYRQLPASAWTTSGWAAGLLLGWLAVERIGSRAHWPFAATPGAYRTWGLDWPAGALCLWTLATLSQPGDPNPLPYLPILNPLELTQLGVLLVAFSRLRQPPANARDRRLLKALFGLLVFGWLNYSAARAVAAFTAIDYPVREIFKSDTFQTTASILWTLTALALMGFGTRRGDRTSWIAGAVLLGIVIIKLFTIDIARLDLLARIVSFLAVGILMLVIGFFAPLPPQQRPAQTRPSPPEVNP